MSNRKQKAQVLKNNDNYCDLVLDWKLQGDKIVFTNGCFDILHAGHVMYLEEAAKLGERLIIGLNDDVSVTQLKGRRRPINKAQDRATLLASMYMVDLIVIFSGLSPLHLVKMIDPDFLVKGGDYKVSEIIGADLVIERGKKVIVMSEKIGYSTTNIIDALQN